MMQIIYNLRCKSFVVLLPTFVVIFQPYTLMAERCSSPFLIEKKYTTESATCNNPTKLEGKHLRVIAATKLPGVYEWQRNSSGHIISTNGTLLNAMEWLSQSYHFTYSFNPTNGETQSIDDIPGRRGEISSLRSGEGDMLIGAIIPTLQRFAVSDFTMPWLEGPFNILIPSPTSTVNIGALSQPMQKEIWICIILSVPVVAACFFGLNKCTNSNERRIKRFHTFENDAQLVPAYSPKIFVYVIGIILNQGGYCRNKTLSFRLLAGIWCLCCFVLIQAYSSTLISFIILPNLNPIINSVYDIPKVPGLKVTVTRNQGPDIQILGTTNSAIARVLQNILTRNPELRCNVTENCLDKVRSGNHVYIHGELFVRNIIMMDKKKTGQCHFTIARDSFWMGYAYFVLVKHSPYTEGINRGILRLKAIGLLDKWIRDYSNYDPNVCHQKNNIVMHKNAKSRLTLKNLASVFVVLVIGYAAAIIAFVFTKIPQLKIYPIFRGF